MKFYLPQTSIHIIHTNRMAYMICNLYMPLTSIHIIQTSRTTYMISDLFTGPYEQYPLH